MAHALRCSPEECVGLLLGEDEIRDIWPLTNVSTSPTHGFGLDPVEVARVLSQSLPVVGLYHSHPGQRPYPSERDSLEFLPCGWHYWIVGEGYWYREQLER